MSTDAPYTDRLIERFNALTHFPLSAQKENERFAAWAAQLEDCAAATLARFGLAEIPDDVRAAIEARKRAEIEWFIRWVRAREIAPPVSVVGPSGYHRHARPEKAHRHLQVGHDKIEAAEQRLQRAIGRYRPSAAISSDDPEAIRKLQEKIDAAEQKQQKMKAANAIIRKHKAGPNRVISDLDSNSMPPESLAALAQLGIGAATARELWKPDFLKRTGYADYELTNNNANIRRMKTRIQELTARRAEPTRTATVDSALIIDNVEENRLQIRFEGRPPRETRDALKRAGFKWAPSAEVWQRYRGWMAVREVERIFGQTLCWTAETADQADVDEPIALPPPPSADLPPAV